MNKVPLIAYKAAQSSLFQLAAWDATVQTKFACVPQSMLGLKCIFATTAMTQSVTGGNHHKVTTASVSWSFCPGTNGPIYGHCFTCHLWYQSQWLYQDLLGHLPLVIVPGVHQKHGTQQLFKSKYFWIIRITSVHAAGAEREDIMLLIQESLQVLLQEAQRQCFHYCSPKLGSNICIKSTARWFVWYCWRFAKATFLNSYWYN